MHPANLAGIVMTKVEGGMRTLLPFSFSAMLAKVQDNPAAIIDKWLKQDAKPQVIDMFNDKLFRLISLIDCDEIPLTIFTRALMRLSEWNAEGELVERSPSRSMVPLWFQQTFRAADFPDGLELHNRISSVFYPSCVLVQSPVVDTCISMDANTREEIRSSIPDAIQTNILFEILSLIIHGFPEREAEIDYRMEKQYLPIFESTCLPFLLKVNFDDVLHYCNGSKGNSSPSAQTDFLLSTWSFLRRVERSRLKVLPNRVYHLELRIGNYLSLKKAEIDALSLQYLKVSSSITNTLLSSSSRWCIDNIKQNRNYNQPRINAIIGSAILEVWEYAHAVENAWNPTIWMPLNNDCWSSYERLVFAIARRQYSPSTSLKFSVSAEVLVAFKMAHYGHFAVAQEILLRCVPEVQKEHGSFSAEFIISGTELVICCNSLLHPELGAEWAEKIYAHSSPCLEFQYPSLEINLRMAKIDAEIGQGSYKTAMEKLQSLLALETLPSSIILKASLRLLKSYRRQDDTLPSLNIWDIYGKALSHVHLVSSPLFHEFLLEALSIFSHIRNRARSQVKKSQLSGIIQACAMLKDTILLTESIKGRLVEDIPKTVLEYYIHTMRNYAVKLGTPPLKPSLTNMEEIRSTAEDSKVEPWDKKFQQEPLFLPGLEKFTETLKTSLTNMKGIHLNPEDSKAELWDATFQREPLFSPGLEKLTETTRDAYKGYFKFMRNTGHLVPYGSDLEKELGKGVEYPREKGFNSLFVLPEKLVVGRARRSRSHAANTREQITTDPLKKDDIEYKLRQNNEVTALKAIYEEDFTPAQTLRSVGAMTEDPPDRALWLSNLGLRLSNKYEEGAMTDLEEAIQVTKRAVVATLEDNPYRASRLNNLGAYFNDKYKRTGAISDLEGAIRVSWQAFDATPKDHPDRARWLSNLGLRLSNRYEKTGAISDLEEAIQVSKRAVDATPEDDSYFASRLNNLGAHLNQRYRKSGVKADLEEAIYVSQRAVDATPEDHLYYAGRLKNLEAHLDQRYREAEAIAD